MMYSIFHNTSHKIFSKWHSNFYSFHFRISQYQHDTHSVNLRASSWSSTEVASFKWLLLLLVCVGLVNIHTTGSGIICKFLRLNSFFKSFEELCLPNWSLHRTPSNHHRELQNTTTSVHCSPEARIIFSFQTRGDQPVQTSIFLIFTVLTNRFCALQRTSTFNAVRSLDGKQATIRTS